MSAPEPNCLHEKCDRCGVVGQDRRTLFMACLYEMSELGVPFVPFAVEGVPLRYVGRDERWGSPRFEHVYDRDPIEPQRWPSYTLTVCKACRSEWMIAIVAWFRAPPDPAINRSNNDENLPTREPLSTILADAERVRTDLIAIQARLEAALPELRLVHATWDNIGRRA